MSASTKLLFLLAAGAFLVFTTRFLAHPPLSINVADFAGGMGIGFLIGAVVTWAGERGSV